MEAMPYRRAKDRMRGRNRAFLRKVSLGDQALVVRRDGVRPVVTLKPSDLTLRSKDSLGVAELLVLKASRQVDLLRATGHAFIRSNSPGAQISAIREAKNQMVVRNNRVCLRNDRFWQMDLCLNWLRGLAIHSCCVV